MSIYLAEFLGTAILIILGDGVVANVVLNKTKGNNTGLIVIAFGWALAVAIPVFIFGPISGTHINPAVTLSLAVVGDFPWSQVPGYIIAQMFGAFVGACIVYLQYKDHFDATDDADAKRAVFCTGPAIKNTFSNFVSEFIGTFILVFSLLGFVNTKLAEGMGGFVVGGIILVIGLSLGGTTGYAINPARDLGPRIAHALLPIKDKKGSDWWYAWIPVVAPICGAVVAAVFFKAVF
ncbi:MIP/aquaporin family protein [Clostridium sp.]|uniref:MIP/aquaporin family protein n=1 Tax=Clostridium sp. TaxID=1506 RepID=UPI003D6CE347